MAPRFPGTALAALGLAEVERGGSAVLTAEPIDLLVNTSAVGLHGESFNGDVAACVRRGGAVFDMVYAVEPTPLIAAARAAGLAAADGLGMLAGQGEAAFRLWFNATPPERLMLQSLTGGPGG